METVLSILGFLNPLKIIAYFGRPKLDIFYDANETYHKAVDLSFNNILGNFGHVMVKNTGKTTAKNCVAKLQSVDVLRNGEFVSVPEYRNIMTLKWAHELDFLPKDIDSDYPVRLDLCYVHQGNDILRFATKKYPGGNQTDFLPGKYRVKIKVNCDNTSSVEKSFIVELLSGDFNSLQISNI